MKALRPRFIRSGRIPMLEQTKYYEDYEIGEARDTTARATPSGAPTPDATTPAPR